MRIAILLIGITALLFGSVFAIHLGISQGLVLVAVSLVFSIALAANFDFFKQSIIDRAQKKNARIFQNVVITKGAMTVANRSGLQSATAFNDAHQVPFVVVFKHGIDGALTLDWSQLKAIEYIGNNLVVLELVKTVKFFNTEHVELLFSSAEDAEDFFHLVKKKITLKVKKLSSKEDTEYTEQ